MGTSHRKSTHDSIDILKFWHIVEFFTPFDLDEVCSKPSAKYKLTEEQLVENGNHHLPWLSERAFEKIGGMPAYEYRYNLYLLPFNKNELTKISQAIFPCVQEGFKHFEFEENFDDQGETCFAQIPLDNKGQPAWDKISISTLPWALGQLSLNEIHNLNYKYYASEKQKLSVELSLLSSHIRNPEPGLIKDREHVEAGALTAQGLGALFVILKSWARFSPDHPIAVVIESIKMGPKEIQKNLPAPVEAKQLALLLDDDIIEERPKCDDEESSEEVAAVDLSEQVSILNSFYLEDLEKIINDITSTDHDLLSPYVSGIPENKKTDLHIKENYLHIIEKLRPCYMNHGRWPVDDQHFMSLMQQFVINECFYPSNEHLLFSVNGPPGTGKTTLFQDIAAENIARRARILSEFNAATDTFTNSLTISFANKDCLTIDLLNEKLLGFEMIVVSSNNAAVENISKEFPLKRKIPEKYQTKISYLESVASKVFSTHKKDKIIPLQAEDKPWGLISIALGNSKNRTQFNERVFFKPDSKENAEIRIKNGETLTIWEWRKQYKGLTFYQAKSAFINADSALHDYLNSINRLEILHQKIGYTNLDSYCKEYSSTLKLLEMQEEKLISIGNELSAELKKIQEEKTHIINTIHQHRQFSPRFYHWLFQTKKARTYEEQCNKLSNDWNILLNQERILKEKIRQIESQSKEITENKNITISLVETKKAEYTKLKDEYCSLCAVLNDITLPGSNHEAINHATQCRAFWQNEKLNALRVNLFAAALTLHEAWLAEVLQNRRFIGNLFAISNLLSNRRPVKTQDELHIWQSLFMWVPVISSTFASIARQFKNIGRQTFGYFLIDEAGQAIPQAASGALWRAKQALVVGDPLQIEPVFTTPPNLIEGLAEYLLKSEYEQWLPTLISVQTLADNANFLGTYTNVADKNQWVGCPLRVHRRCLDPMFSVANQIAYDHQMINVREDSILPTKKYPLGKSCWYDVKGDATDKQYVPAQGQLLLNLLVQLYEQEQDLPKLYIITPFKRIKQHLKDLIGNLNNWSNSLTVACKLPKSDILQKWCAQNIGTVHTFQGKESSSVIFVLGADHQTLGAANWASSKPNLLNVALTRAKDRVYVIGDHALWSSKRYFSDLSQSLPINNKYLFTQ